MLRYVFIYYAMICYAMLGYVMLCYVMVCYGTLCYVVLRSVLLCYIKLHSFITWNHNLDYIRSIFGLHVTQFGIIWNHFWRQETKSFTDGIACILYTCYTHATTIQQNCRNKNMLNRDACMHNVMGPQLVLMRHVRFIFAHNCLMCAGSSMHAGAGDTWVPHLFLN